MNTIGTKTKLQLASGELINATALRAGDVLRTVKIKYLPAIDSPEFLSWRTGELELEYTEAEVVTLKTVQEKVELININNDVWLSPVMLVLIKREEQWMWSLASSLVPGDIIVGHDRQDINVLSAHTSEENSSINVMTSVNNSAIVGCNGCFVILTQVAGGKLMQFGNEVLDQDALAAMGMTIE
tara:strand:- start:194463 stop:195014 length:552 start_codon:yes stop_codon:yes gene_type:complete